MVQLSKRLQTIKPSPTLSVKQKAIDLKNKGIDVIDFSSGEPDFFTPPHICEAAKIAIDEGKHRYTAVDGIPALKNAIIDKLKRDNNLSYDSDQIIATSGAKMAIYNAMMATLEPGDEVVIPAPYWVSYTDIVMLAEGQPVIVKCDAHQGFKITPEQLEKAITQKTKWVMLNSPNNPTGAVYSKNELEALGECIRKHPHVSILSDDIYELIVYDEVKFHTFAEVNPDLIGRTLIINGASKTYAMTGWRLGYAAGPAPLIKAMNTIQSQSTSNPCTITQYAAVSALNGDQSFLNYWREEYTYRRDVLVEKLNAIDGLSCEAPHGAFYIYANCEGLIGKTTPKGLKITSDVELSEFMMEECHVAVIPGTAFGLSPYIRFTYCLAMEDLIKGIENVKKGFNTLK